MNKGTPDRFDGTEIFAVKEKVIEGRQGDQHNRRDAEHSEREITLFEVAFG
jgi:hypothetical protein